jgi:hypothetical protein
MSDEKKKEDLPNKSFTPANNKNQVRIQMRPGRAFDGVVVDADGYATVDAQTAARLIEINYAILAEEK